MKSRIQAILDKAGVYHRLKASYLYDAYWRVVDPEVIKLRESEVLFYRRLLAGFRSGHLIFDVGANHGAKTDVFLRLGAKVVAVEPDETNQKILAEKFFSLRISRIPLVIVPKAAADGETPQTMWIHEPGSAKNTLSRKWVETLRNDSTRFGSLMDFTHQLQVETTTLESLAREYGRPFFIKIDVEGTEPRVIRGLGRPVPYLSFEVNLPEFLPEGLESVAILKALDCNGSFNYVLHCHHGLVLPNWATATEMNYRLGSCRAPSIEVFWRSSGWREFI